MTVPDCSMEESHLSSARRSLAAADREIARHREGARAAEARGEHEEAQRLRNRANAAANNRGSLVDAVSTARERLEACRNRSD